MSRYRYRTGRRPLNNPGFDAAIEHIREYEELEFRLGPIVEDVKNAFFNLSNESRRQFFRSYKNLYGSSAESYAVETFPKWRNGDRKMSGQTARRLLDLVPKYLTARQRFDMVDRLCKHHAQTNYKSIYIDRKNPEEAFPLIKEAINEISQTSLLKSLPDHVMETVQWLSDNDITVSRGILAELENQRRKETAAAIERQWPRIYALILSKEAPDFSESFLYPGGEVRIYSENRSNCFLASAVFQDSNHPDVMALREYRDCVLRNSQYGRFSITIYEKIGPTLARLVFLFPKSRHILNPFFSKFSTIIKKLYLT